MNTVTCEGAASPTHLCNRDAPQSNCRCGKTSWGNPRVWLARKDILFPELCRRRIQPSKSMGRPSGIRSPLKGEPETVTPTKEAITNQLQGRLWTNSINQLIYRSNNWYISMENRLCPIQNSFTLNPNTASAQNHWRPLCLIQTRSSTWSSFQPRIRA